MQSLIPLANVIEFNDIQGRNLSNNIASQNALHNDHVVNSVNKHSEQCYTVGLVYPIQKNNNNSIAFNDTQNLNTDLFPATMILSCVTNILLLFSYSISWHLQQTYSLVQGLQISTLQECCFHCKDTYLVLRK